MTETIGGVPAGFATKLNRLFETVRPPGAPEREYTHEEVASGVAAAGGPSISPTQVWMLRSGRRDGLTKRHLDALAQFFGVTPAYFFAGARGAQLEEQLAAWVASGAWLHGGPRADRPDLDGRSRGSTSELRDPDRARAGRSVSWIAGSWTE